MKIRLIALSLLTLAVISCESYTSTALDDSSYAKSGTTSDSNTTDPAAIRFAAAQQVLSSSRCLACHAPDSGVSSGSKWSASYTETQWVSSGLVVAGNPTSSKVFYRLRDPQGGGGNMPPTGNLTQAEYDAIQEWITKMTP